MELTGKCKEEFEKWYFKNYVKTTKKFKDLYPHEYSDIYDWFYNLQESMKYGVLVDYFDSVGNRITINAGVSQFWVDIYTDLLKDISWDSEMLDTRKEAIDVAIEKANELRNEVLNK
mgnify:FL=1